MQEEILIAAKPHKRILALLIDLLINCGVYLILLIPAFLALINVFHIQNHANIFALFAASLTGGMLIISFAIFYFVFLPCIWEGQTIGKRILNIRIIDVTTNEGPNARVMFVREAPRILILILSFGVSAIASLVTLCISKNHTTFHEQVSNTRVVNVNILQEIEQK